VCQHDPDRDITGTKNRCVRAISTEVELQSTILIDGKAENIKVSVG